MPDCPDFVTIDAYERPPGGNVLWRRRVRRALASHLPGLRAVTVNHANNGTHAMIPRVVPAGSALVMAWESRDSAEAAWCGPLRGLMDGRGAFSLDGEVVRSRVETDGDNWHGWSPRADAAVALDAKEPLVAIVHGVLHPRSLARFLRNNAHAASRAAHHPGHRGSIDISSQLPFEHTSISLWKTLKMAQDYAYAPGGHATAMSFARTQHTHRTGVYLQVRPLASSGSLGLAEPAFPELPPACRGRHNI
jgi:hypothetical protein